MASNNFVTRFYRFIFYFTSCWSKWDYEVLGEDLICVFRGANNKHIAYKNITSLIIILE